MRLLLACEFYYPSVGGVQEVMRQVAERLARSGHSVTVATTYASDRHVERIHDVEVKQFRITGNLVRGMEGEVSRYRGYVLRQDYDLLMIKAAQQWTFDALIPVLKEIRKPKIFVPCGFSGMFDPAYSEYYRTMPQWLRFFDRLVFYASDYRDINMARSHGLTNIRIVPNGADEREFNACKDQAFRSRHAIPEESFVVMTVGNLTGQKGHAELAAAFEKCDFGARPACLLLVGNTPSALTDWRARARDMYRLGGVPRVAKWLLRPVLEKLGLRGILIALGYAPVPAPPQRELERIVERINAMEGRKAMLVDFPRSEVIQAYLNSDLFVLASRIEYSPLVLFEAAAAGLPFLSVPVGNASEIAEWTGGGIICGAHVDAAGYTRVDPDKLAREIETLAERPEMLARLAVSGRKAWEERFSWDIVFRVYEQIFKECMAETPA